MQNVCFMPAGVRERGMDGVCVTNPARQATEWIESQCLGTCSKRALRKTRNHVQYVFILTRGLCSLCLLLVPSQGDIPFTQQN